MRGTKYWKNYRRSMHKFTQLYWKSSELNIEGLEDKIQKLKRVNYSYCTNETET